MTQTVYQQMVIARNRIGRMQKNKSAGDERELLRRIAGNPVHGENYFRVEIVDGRARSEQSALAT